MRKLGLGLGFAAVVLSGLMAGFFATYSISVMPGLNDAPPEIAIAAMQGINRMIRSASFFFGFFMTPVFTAAAGLGLIVARARVAGGVMLSAGLIYAIGIIVLTANVNVPMNNALAVIDVAALSPGEARTVWVQYMDDWSWWNHVRSLISGLCFVLSGHALVLAQR